ncbi:hypothetical protein WJX81_000543 [Elliptochloris bilobata]|uniref:USP domain-containing protein n=1 Tax=Elliptochloris bilobata TaxID=381761 RepID=A0AAW1S633_9CHLO
MHLPQRRDGPPSAPFIVPPLQFGSNESLHELELGEADGPSKRSPGTSSVSSPHAVGAATAGVEAVVAEADLKRLRLVRGLSNDSGLNNCFLNVVIQSLWHLRPFREALLGLPQQALGERGAAPEDLRVLRALWDIFNVFATPPEAPAVRPASEGRGACAHASAEGRDDDVGLDWAVSPTELREALSGLGRAAVNFELSEMHDASEVMDNLFCCLHRAELGGEAERCPDPQLPVRVRLPAGGSATPTAPRRAGPRSIVQTLFGIDVQVPVPPDDEEDAGASKRARGPGSAVVGRWTDIPSRSSSTGSQRAGTNAGGAAAGAGPAPPRRPRDPAVVEAAQFMKYFHLVPAAGLRAAYERAPAGAFEDLLRGADGAEARAGGSGGAGRLAGAVHTNDVTLLRRPSVFTLAVGWESVQVSQQAIDTTVGALAPALDVGRLFRGVPPLLPHALRCIICYRGHHYCALALSEELQRWLLFNDANVRLVGGWREVAAYMREERLQPSLLFYERADA